MTRRLTDLVTERTREGFLLLDGDGTVVDANPAARRLLGADGSIDWSDAPGEDSVDDESTRTIEVSVDGETRVVEAETTPVDGVEDVDRLVRLGDVTERAVYEDELERYERIVDAMGDGIYVLDADGRVADCNEFMVELTGYDRESILGADPSTWYDDSDVEAFEGAIRALLRGEEETVKTVEATVERGDGEQIPIEVTLTVLTSEGGEFRGTVGVVRDVTERRERQQELERYETLLDVMPDTVVVTDTEGRHVDIHGFEGWSGYDKEELIGEHLSLTTTRESIERAEELIVDLFRNDDVDKVTYEMPVVTKDGERIPHENHLAPLPPDEDGMIPGSISVLRDISERRAHERALEALNATTRELVSADSREAVVEMAVRTATGVLELPLAGVWLYDEDEEALVPASYPDAQELPDDPPTFRPGESLAWEVFESGRPRLYEDLAEDEAVHNPGTAIQSEVIAPVGDHGVLLAGTTDPGAFHEGQRDLAGILGAAVGTALDRLDREQERERQRRELRRKNEQLEQFASVLSHDLRNPLNVAHARVRHALDSGDTEKLESADDALSRMNDLIEDLLTLAREGQIVGEKAAVSLRGVANDAWRSVEAPDASLTVAEDVTIRADRARLSELLGNLFRNGVEHAGPDVAIRVGPLPDGGFYVEDDGPGVPPEDHDRVFDQGVTSSADGTGFGLAIVASIAEAHGWSVSLTEGSDGGARFEFDLGESNGHGEGSSG